MIQKERKAKPQSETFLNTNNKNIKTSKYFDPFCFELRKISEKFFKNISLKESCKKLYGQKALFHDNKTVKRYYSRDVAAHTTDGVRKE